MADVLTMTAGEFRNPIAVVIAVVANDGAIHFINESSRAPLRYGPNASTRPCGTRRVSDIFRAGRNATALSSPTPNADLR